METISAKDAIQAKLLADAANNLPKQMELSRVQQNVTIRANAGHYDYVWGGLFTYSETTATLLLLGYTVVVVGSGIDATTTVGWA